MPRSGSEIDKDLAATRESLGKIEVAVGRIEGDVAALQELTRMREGNSAASLSRLETVCEKLRDEQGRSQAVLARIENEVDHLKRELETRRTRSWSMVSQLLYPILVLIVGLLIKSYWDYLQGSTPMVGIRP